MEKNITMKDIASYLNIDRTTVSKALTGSKTVSVKTIERVKQAAEELGYRKDSFASGLMTGKNTVLGIILPEISSGIHAAFVESFQRVARKYNYGVVLYTVQLNGDDLINIIDLLKQQRVSGATFISGATQSKHDKHLIKLTHSGMAVNTTTRSFIHENIDRIVYNHRKAGYDLTEYLIQAQHRNIVFVTHSKVTSTPKERLEGYLEAMHANGLQPVVIEDHIKNAKSPGEQMKLSYGLMKRMWSSLEQPSAFIGVNDSFALGILHMLKEEGVSIPDEAAIAGFDDLYAIMGIPQITSMRMPISNAGERAAELLIERINKKEKSSPDILLDYEMILRESTASIYYRKEL